MAKGAPKKRLPCTKDGNTQTRKQKGFPLATAAGREEAKAAGWWWTLRGGGEDALKLAQVVPPALDLLYPTWYLPGYLPAWNSALLAYGQLFGRLRSVRELYRAARNGGNKPGRWDFRTTRALVLAEFDGASHGEFLPTLVRQHQDEGTRTPFVHELGKREANAARKTLPVPLVGNDGQMLERGFPLGDVPPLRQTLVQMWVAGGFWLRSDEDIAAFLSELRMPFARENGPAIVTADNVKHIRNDLKLKSYRGRGRIVYCKPGWMKPDAILEQEVSEAVRFLHARCFFQTFKDCTDSLITGKVVGTAAEREVWKCYWEVASCLEGAVFNDCPSKSIT